jgi:DivIVA domain-containing protein
MPFAPHEIENKRFVVALRGYQTDEVEAFLRAVAADYRAALEQRGVTTPDHLVAEIDRVMRRVRDEAEQEAAEIRAAAEREAAEIRQSAQREADVCFAEIARQAEELGRVERRLWARMHALEHAVVEAREAMSHIGDLYPAKRAVETSVGEAIAAR